MKKTLVILIVCVSLISCTLTKETNTTTQFANEKSQEEIIIDNLYLTGKIWGFLKYHHPNVIGGNQDWDAALIEILPEIIEAKSPKERDSILLNWVNQLGSYNDDEFTRQVGLVYIEPSVLDWILESEIQEELTQQLEGIRKANRRNSNHYVSFRESSNPAFNNEEPYYDMAYPTTEYRLLSLFRFWNIVEYYFPYKYLIGNDWDSVLKEFIPKFMEAEGQLEYLLVTLEAIASINDTHARLLTKHDVLEEYWGLNFAPLEAFFIDDNLVISRFEDVYEAEASGLIIGDIIRKIDGKAVGDIINERTKYTSASNHPTLLREIAYNILRTNAESIEIEYERDGELYTTLVKANRQERVNRRRPIQDYAFKMVESDIAYINIGLLKDNEIEAIMEEIKDTKGLILDVRMYPSFYIHNLSKHLLPKRTEFYRITQGSGIEPGLFIMKDPDAAGSINPDFYKGKVVIINNELTQSYGEFSTMLYRKIPSSVVIGSTTAGADGNVSEFYLPGGIQTRISGIGIYYPDGTITQRVGIVPDIEVKPTIEGIKNNIDELLDKAVEIIREAK